MSKFEREKIAAIIGEKGPMGVNALAMELGVAPSSLQRYLTTQDYFRRTANRQWDLPDNVTIDTKANTLVLMADSALAGTRLLQANITEFGEQLEIIIKSLDILKKNIFTYQKNINPPVADSRFADFESANEKLRDAIKRNRDNIPEEYYDLIYNYDHVGYIIEVGKKSAVDFLESQLAPLILGDHTELSDETVTILKENQR